MNHDPHLYPPPPFQVVCCCRPCQEGGLSHEQRCMRPAGFEAHSGLGQCKKPKLSVKMVAGIRLAGAPNVSGEGCGDQAGRVVT